ncbi:MAG: hypothetical protein ACK5F7_19690, partial [Planctomycetaceae bacterium]
MPSSPVLSATVPSGTVPSGTLTTLVNLAMLGNLAKLASGTTAISEGSIPGERGTTSAPTAPLTLVAGTTFAAGTARRSCCSRRLAPPVAQGLGQLPAPLDPTWPEPTWYDPTWYDPTWYDPT